MSSPTRKRINKQWLNPLFSRSGISRQTLKRYKETCELATRSVSELNTVDSYNRQKHSNFSGEISGTEGIDSGSLPPMPIQFEQSFFENVTQSTKIDEAYQVLNKKLRDYSEGNVTVDTFFSEDKSTTSSSTSTEEFISEDESTVTSSDSVKESDESEVIGDIDSDYSHANSFVEDEIFDIKFDTSSMNGSFVMFPDSGLKISDVLLMITTFSTEKNFSQRDENDLIDFVKVLAGPRFEHWKPSLYHRSKTYDPPLDKIHVNFYCETCNKIIVIKKLKNQKKKTSAVCEKCKKNYNISLDSPNHFLTIDIEYQLKLLLNHPQLQASLIQNLCKIDASRNSSCITDIYDTELYRKLQLNLPGTLTFNCNTDGAPVFKHSKKSFWPIQLYINELPSELRFVNRILAGLFVTNTEPKPALMELYLSTLCSQIQQLQKKGIKIKNHESGELMTLKFYLLACCVDSVARPVIQNRIQYSGYWGCSWCYIHGDYIGHAIHYTMKQEDPPIRTHENYIKETRQAALLNVRKPPSKKDVTILGVKGESAFSKNLEYFDCVWGFPTDKQHGVALGIARQLWNIWTSTKIRQEYRLTPKQIAEIDRRLASITPCHEIPRLPLPASQFNQWKANQCEAWVQYWCIPCLEGILHKDLYESLSLLVRSIHTLSKSKITDFDIMESEYNLLKFVGECQLFYGKAAMTFNIHSLLHYCMSVRKTGPQWATSTYAFEDGIGLCKSQVNGPRGIAQQIAKKILKRLMLHSAIDKNTESASCGYYCHSLLGPSRPAVANYTKLEDGTLLIGTGQMNSKLEDKMKMFLNNQNVKIKVFDRCIYRNSVFHGDTYNRAQRTNDSAVLLKSKKVILIEKFILVDDICYLFGKELAHSEAIFNNKIQLRHIHEINNVCSGNKIIEEISSIEEKVMKLSINGRKLIIWLSNVLKQN